MRRCKCEQQQHMNRFTRANNMCGWMRKTAHAPAKPPQKYITSPAAAAQCCFLAAMPPNPRTLQRGSSATLPAPYIAASAPP